MNTVYIPGSPSQYPNYHRAIISVGGAVQWEGNPMYCDALLLPGGGDLEPWRYGQENTASYHLDPRRDAEEFALLDQFTAARKPILGICRGLQSINVFFGGTLLQDITGHNTASGADTTHPIQTVSSPLQGICGDCCLVNSAHHQAIDRLGTGLKVTQWAPDGIIEAIRHSTHPIFALQWHPERLQAPHGLAIFDYFLALAE